MAPSAVYQAEEMGGRRRRLVLHESMDLRSADGIEQL